MFYSLFWLWLIKFLPFHPGVPVLVMVAALARLYLEYLDTVIAPRALAGVSPPKAQEAATELAAWLTARGVRRPAERTERGTVAR